VRTAATLCMTVLGSIACLTLSPQPAAGGPCSSPEGCTAYLVPVTTLHYRGPWITCGGQPCTLRERLGPYAWNEGHCGSRVTGWDYCPCEGNQCLVYAQRAIAVCATGARDCRRGSVTWIPMGIVPLAEPRQCLLTACPGPCR
jgi:hypothetical protein